MDGKVLHRTVLPHAQRVLFQRELVGDALFLSGKRRGVLAAFGVLDTAGALADSSRAGVAFRSAAPGQQRGSQCKAYKVLVFYGGLLSLFPPVFWGGVLCFAARAIRCNPGRRAPPGRPLYRVTSRFPPVRGSSVCNIPHLQEKCPHKKAFLRGKFFKKFLPKMQKNPPSIQNEGGFFGGKRKK